MTKIGMNVTKVEEMANKKRGDEGCWKVMMIAMVYAAMKSALKNSEIYSAILFDEILIMIPLLQDKLHI